MSENERYFRCPRKKGLLKCDCKEGKNYECEWGSPFYILGCFFMNDINKEFSVKEISNITGISTIKIQDLLNKSFNNLKNKYTMSEMSDLLLGSESEDDKIEGTHFITYKKVAILSKKRLTSKISKRNMVK
jgi:hypothetical protein